MVGMIVHRIAPASSRSHCSSEPRRIDPLTGLPDRAALLGRLAALLQGQRACDRQFALIFLDLDNFKRVNDEFGHLVGDTVLEAAARRIANCIRERDMVSRYGGDEFVALIDGVTAMEDVQAVIGRIRTSLDRPIGLLEGDVRLSLSAGVAFAAQGCGSPEELLRAADQAMYAAKRSTAGGESREP
jgi:diguanylate cyclase (GGDEF)-like protein